MSLTCRCHVVAMSFECNIINLVCCCFFFCVFFLCGYSEVVDDNPYIGELHGGCDESSDSDCFVVVRGRPKLPPLPLESLVYDGARYSLQKCLTKLLHFQSDHKLSQASMHDLYELLQKLLPKHNLVPSYRRARQAMLSNSGIKLVQMVL